MTNPITTLTNLNANLNAVLSPGLCDQSKRDPDQSKRDPLAWPGLCDHLNAILTSLNAILWLGLCDQSKRDPDPSKRDLLAWSV